MNQYVCAHKGHDDPAAAEMLPIRVRRGYGGRGHGQHQILRVGGPVASRPVPASVGKLVASELHRPHHADLDKGGLATLPHELAQVPARLHSGVRKRRLARRSVEAAEKVDQSLRALHVNKQLEALQVTFCLQRCGIAERVGQAKAARVANIGAEGDLGRRIARSIGDRWGDGRLRNCVRAGRSGQYYGRHGFASSGRAEG